MVHRMTKEVREQTAACLRYLRTVVFQLNQREMADKIGIVRPQYTNYELGKKYPLEETLVRMSVTLGLPVAAFFDLEIAKREGAKLVDSIRQEQRAEHDRKEIICSHIFGLRTYLEVPQHELAKEMGVSASMISTFERGESVDSLTEDLCAAMIKCFRISEDVLLDEEAYQAFVPEEYRIPAEEWERLSPVIGSRLRTIRTQKRITVRDVEVATKIQYTMVSACETGNRVIPRRHVKTFADLYGVSVHSLIAKDGDEFVNSFMQLPSRKEAREAKRIVRFAQIGLTQEARLARSKEISTSMQIICMARGVTAQDLADKLGVTLSTIHRWTHGEYPLSLATLPQVAQALQVPVETLLDHQQASQYVANGCPNYGPVLPENEHAPTVTNDQDTLAWRMLYLRNQRKMTRSQMGKALGVPVEQILNWENASSIPNQLEFMAIAGVLNVPSHILQSKSAFDIFLAQEKLI